MRPVVKKLSSLNLAILAVIFTSIFLISSTVQQRNEIRGRAQTPTPSAESQCSPARKVQLAIGFPNPETYAIMVDVETLLPDQTTIIRKRYENVVSGQTLTDILPTNLDSISSGQVTFTWAPQDPTNTAGIETDSAFYTDIICTLPTATPIPTEEPTPTQEPTPTEEPTPTQEPTPTEEPTPTQEPTPTEVVPSFTCLGACITPSPTAIPVTPTIAQTIPSLPISSIPTIPTDGSGGGGFISAILNLIFSILKSIF